MALGKPSKKLRHNSLAGPRAPAADALRNIAVPQGAAQQYESKGNNYRRLAQALDQAGSQLGHGLTRLGSSMMKMEALEKEKAAQHDVLTSIAEGKYGSGTRHEVHVETGSDPAVSTIKNSSDAKAQIIAPAALANDEWLTKQGNLGWKKIVPEGTSIANKDGTMLMPGDEIGPMTPKDIEAWAQKRAAELIKQVPGHLAEADAIRERLGQGVLATAQKAMKQLDAYRRNERSAAFDSVVTSETVPFLNAQNEADPKGSLADRFVNMSETLRKQMNADGSTREDGINVGLKSVLNSLTNPETSSLETARSALRLIQDPLGNTGRNLENHGKYNSVTKSIRIAAVNTIAKHERDAAVAATEAELLQMLADGEDVRTINLEDIVVAGHGRTKFTATKKDILDSVAAERDRRLLSARGGQAKELNVDDQMRLLVYGQRGSGLDSPMLKSLFKDFSLDPQDPKFVQQFEAYKALQMIDPFQTDDYMGRDTERLFTQVELISQAQGIPPQQAAELVAARRPENGRFPSLLLKHNKGRQDWEKQTDLPRHMREDVLDAYDIVYAEGEDADRGTARQRLKEIEEKFTARMPKLNGQYIRIPKGANKLNWLTKMEAFRDESGFFKKLGVDGKSVQFVFDGAGYQIFTDGVPRTWPQNGKPVYIDASKIEAFNRQLPAIRAKANLKKAMDEAMVQRQDPNTENPFDLTPDKPRVPAYTSQKLLDELNKGKGKGEALTEDQIRAKIMRDNQRALEEERKAAEDGMLAP